MSGSPSNDRLQSLQSSISQYLAQTAFDAGGQDDIDRIERRLASNPEKFITPNPGVPYQEDLSGNWERIKDEFGLTPKRELDEQLANYDDRVQDFLLDSIRQVIGDVGVFAVANYVYGGISTGDRAADNTIDDILNEASPDVFRAEIDNRLGNIEQEVPGGLGFERQDSAADDALALLNEVTSRQYGDIRRAIDDIETQLQNAESAARQEILNRFESAFGQRFDSVDDAINSLRDQFTQLQNLDIETVEAAFLGGGDTPGVSLPAGFSGLESAVKNIASDVIDLQATADALPSRNRRRAFADVRVREGEIERVDFGKAVTDDVIVLRPDADLAQAPDPAIGGVDDDADSPELVVPEPDDDPGDDADEEPEPDVELTIESDEINEEAVELATNALEAAEEFQGAGDSLRAFAEALTTEDVATIERAAAAAALPQPLLEQLRDLFNRAGRSGRADARQATFGIGRLQDELGFPITTPDTSDIEVEETDDPQPQPDSDDRQQPPRDRRDTAGDDVEEAARDAAEDAIRDFTEAVFGESGLQDPNSDIQPQPGTNRPEPRQPDADKKLMRYLDNSLGKAQTWTAAESDRLSRTDPPLPPAEYWSEFGERFYGSQITREQFVNLTTDGLR